MRTSTRLWLGAFAVAVAGAGLLIVTQHSPAGATAPIPNIGASRADGPSPSASSPPSTEADTASGAVRTALAVVAAEPQLVSDSDAAASALLLSWAAPQSAQALLAQLRQERASFQASSGGPYTFDVAALAGKVVTSNAGPVTVQLWCVEVVFAQGRPTTTSYLIESLQLVWDGRWRLSATSDTPAAPIPLAPTQEQTSSSDAAQQLAGLLPVGALLQGA